MSTAKKEYKRVTVKSLVDMKKRGEKISMLTSYDYSMAKNCGWRPCGCHFGGGFRQ